MGSFFYSQIERSDNNEKLISSLEDYSNSHNIQMYLINSPLGDGKYNYHYEDGAIVMLSPNHRISFLNVGDNADLFNNYILDFIEDLGSISDKYEYKKYIGRPREWQEQLIASEDVDDSFEPKIFLDKTLLTDQVLRRKCELLISLLVGSINDIKQVGVSEPETTLDKVKRKIVLFDGEQTRFIYKTVTKKKINIQGLSGTGKTELLLHKLKELYTGTDDSKIFFTCHNKILSSSIKQRIPEFFNFMKVEKQIKWEERLWAINAWGSLLNKDSGVYRYICDFYSVPFNRYSKYMDFEKACKSALDEINANDSCKNLYAFDYILIDESQDFPESFFALCDRVTSTAIYIAGDIFQDIFDNDIEKKAVDADFVLNRCYRTDPRTLMFAQAAGMGLFENKKLNWLSDEEWKASGYIIKRDSDNAVRLYREPVRRFDELEADDVLSMNIFNVKTNTASKIMDLLKIIIKQNPTVNPDDIAIILMDNDNSIYKLADVLELEIAKYFSWGVNKGYESKEKIQNKIFVSNRNNVKGLEFPFVLCVTNKILSDLKYRNTLYTMLTRSFIQSFLLVADEYHVKQLENGLQIINSDRCIKTIQPTEEERRKIKNTIIKLKQGYNVSYKEFLTGIFDELRIDSKHRKRFEKIISESLDDKFNRDDVIDVITANKKFICK